MMLYTHQKDFLLYSEKTIDPLFLSNLLKVSFSIFPAS